MTKLRKFGIWSLRKTVRMVLQFAQILGKMETILIQEKQQFLQSSFANQTEKV